jgi:uncharacterized membrane protein HdeD (DUF308 family)
MPHHALTWPSVRNGLDHFVCADIFGAVFGTGLSSLYVLGLFLGIDLIFIGVSRIALGLGLRRVRI